MEKKFPYIKYSYLYESFLFYVPRIAGTNYIKMENHIWEIAVKNRGIQKVVKGWFPDATVFEFRSDRDKKYKDSWQAWNRRKLELNVAYEKEIVKDFKEELTKIWGYKQLNKLMPLFSHYKCVRAGNDKRKYKFIEK